MAAFSPIAVARVSSMQELHGYADRTVGGGTRTPTNTMVTVDGPLDAQGMPHPAAVVAQQRMDAVLHNAMKHPDKVTALELAEALAAAHADGTDTQLESFAKRWLAASRKQRNMGLGPRQNPKPTITDAELRAFRNDAETARDYEMSALCSLALGGHAALRDAEVGTTAWKYRHALRKVGKAQARAHCAMRMEEGQG